MNPTNPLDSRSFAQHSQVLRAIEALRDQPRSPGV